MQQVLFPDASVEPFLLGLILSSPHLQTELQSHHNLFFKITIIYFLKSSFSASINVDLILLINFWSGHCDLDYVQIYVTEWGFKKTHNSPASSNLPNYDFVFKNGNIIMASLLTLHLLEINMSNPFNTTDDGEKVLNILSAYRLSLNIRENFYYFSFWFWVIRLVEDNSCLLLAWPVNRTLLRLAWNYFHTKFLMCLFQTALVKAGSLLPWMHFVSVLLHTHMRESPLKHAPVFYRCKWFLDWNSMFFYRLSIISRWLTWTACGVAMFYRAKETLLEIFPHLSDSEKTT